MRRTDGPTYTRPLRSWVLALRADDTRLPAGVPDEMVEVKPNYFVESERVRLDTSWLWSNLAPIQIDPPGVTVKRASEIFGVSVGTIRAWARRGLLDIRHAKGKGRRPKREPRIDPRTGYTAYDWERANELRADRERGQRRHVAHVTTNGFILPSGEVTTMDWDRMARAQVIAMVPDDWTQELLRLERVLASDRPPRRKPDGAWPPIPRVRQWQCPACGKWVSKVYWGSSKFETRSSNGKQFVCRRCCGVIYESAEITSTPGKGRRVNMTRRTAHRAKQLAGRLPPPR
jgi:hypothetical protein